MGNSGTKARTAPGEESNQERRFESRQLRNQGKIPPWEESGLVRASLSNAS